MARFAGSRLFGSAVIAQAVLSAANFLIGLMLIRYSSAEDYGHYVLAYTLLMLAVAVPGSAVLGPQAVLGGRLEGQARRQLVSRCLVQLLWITGSAAVLAGLLLLLAGLVDARAAEQQALGLALVAASAAAIAREFFRQTLFLQRAPHRVLANDLAFALVSVTGAALAVALLPTAAAPSVMLAAAVAAAGAAVWAYRSLDSRLGWDFSRRDNVLARLWPMGRWALLGSMINWGFVQGFYFVMVAVLDVRAVAAVAATRLLLMPVNLMANGVGQMLLPMAVGWHQSLGGTALLRRLVAIAAALAGLTAIYVGLLWLLADWIMRVVLSREFEDQRLLIALWSVNFLLMVVRTTLSKAPMVIERFRTLSGFEALTALVALVGGFIAMQAYGAVGGILGLIAGEVLGLGMIGAYLWRLHRSGAFRTGTS